MDGHRIAARVRADREKLASLGVIVSRRQNTILLARFLDGRALAAGQVGRQNALAEFRATLGMSLTYQPKGLLRLSEEGVQVERWVTRRD
jgi:hypothetical protein